VTQRVTCFAISAISALVALVGAVTAAGLFRCYGDSCSYELHGYAAHGPNALYGVMGGAAAVLAVIALAGCVVGLRGGARGGRLRPVLAILALVLGSGAVFAVAAGTASA
jgi:hypothetical protein